MSKVKAASVLAAAAAAAALASSAQATVDGVVGMGEYTAPPVLQSAQTSFGNNLSELDGAYTNYNTGTGVFDLALTGNLEAGNDFSRNGLVLFMDSRSGGGIATAVPGGLNQFGSIGGQRSDDWGTDTDGGAAVSPTPLGGSILSAAFNPDRAIEIDNDLSSGQYRIHIIDLTAVNDDVDPNKDIFLGQNTVGPSAVTQTYYRDAGATASGDITHAFDNSNTNGVNGQFDSPGDPATATTGFEASFDSPFMNHEPGTAIRILPFITNDFGDYLSNQILPSVSDADSLGGPGYPGGDPLFDSRYYNSGNMFITVFEPTFTAGANNKWSTSGNWAGNFAPNGVDHAAGFYGAGGTVDLDINATVGSLTFNGSGAYSISSGTGKTLTINAGAGAARIDTFANSNAINVPLIFLSDARIDTASANLTLGNTDNTAGRRITVVGIGALTLAGTQTNGLGASLAVDSGTVTINSDGGSAAALNQDVYVSTPGGGPGATVNLGASQHLNTLTANPNGSIVLTAGGNKIIVVNDVYQGGNGRIDLGNGKMIVKNTPLGSWDGSVYTDVTGLIVSGRNGGTWDGGGLITSQSKALAPNLPRTSLGIARGVQVKAASATSTVLWGGQTITGTDTLIMYTYAGDANLDGKLDADDYGRIDTNIALPINSRKKAWANGDFNYDGLIDIGDYGLLDTNIALHPPVIPTGSGTGGLSVMPVPEPSLGGLMLAAALLGRRRRR